MAGTSSGGWLSSVGALLAALAPKGLCPVCVAASGGFLSSVGLGFLAVDEVIRWVLPVVLVVGLLALFFASRSHRRWLAFAIGASGAVVLYGGWFLSLEPMLYGGMLLLVGASLFNFWAKKHPRVRVQLVQIGRRKVSHG